MIDFRYCQCHNPTFFKSNKCEYCRACWLQKQPYRPPALPAPHNMVVLKEWAEHSRKAGLDIERISRDLRLDAKTVRFLLGRGYETAKVG
jgi:hypothetical protein